MNLTLFIVLLVECGLLNWYLSSNTVNLLFRRCLVKSQPASYITSCTVWHSEEKIGKGHKNEIPSIFSFRTRCSIQNLGRGKGNIRCPCVCVCVCVCVIGWLILRYSNVSFMILILCGNPCSLFTYSSVVFVCDTVWDHQHILENFVSFCYHTESYAPLLCQILYLASHCRDIPFLADSLC